MTENEISYLVRGAVFEIYNQIGPGLLESVYEEALFYELKDRGLKVEKQVDLPLKYKGVWLQKAYRLDLLVEDKVIVEVKSVSELIDLHHKQLLTYLRLTSTKLGLLINFNSTEVKHSIVRIVNSL